MATAEKFPKKIHEEPFLLQNWIWNLRLFLFHPIEHTSVTAFDHSNVSSSDLTKIPQTPSFYILESTFAFIFRTNVYN